MENYTYIGQPTKGCRKAWPLNAFDWTDDGCSGRDQLGPISLVYRNLFNKPCQLHDFGYRNFGQGLTLDRTEARRAWIDNRFLAEMRRLCDASYRSESSAWTNCRTTANAVYGIVRKASNWSKPSGGVTLPVTPAPVYTVMNTSETPPDGVFFRNSARTADTSRIVGLDVYKNERVRVRCFVRGEALGAYANRIWYLVENVTRPTAAGRPNVGYLNAHYVNDDMPTNQPARGVLAC